MAALSEPPGPLDVAGRLGRWVRLGLARFAGVDAGAACKALASPQELDEFAALSTAIEQGVREAPEGGSDAAARLLHLAELPLAECFLVALAGAVEEDYLVVCALAELQAPVAGPRPALHLVEALLSSLFHESWPAPRIACGRACSVGLLGISGEGPWPTRELAIDPRLWAVLRGGVPSWAGSQPLPAADAKWLPAAVQLALPELSARLKQRPSATLLLRASPASGHRRLASRVASELGQRALLVDAEAFRDDPALAWACAAGGWLPVLEPRLGPGETLRFASQAPVSQRAIVCLGQDGAVDAAEIVQLDLGYASYAERAAWWSESLAQGCFGPAAPGLANDVASAALISGELIWSVAERARALQQRDGGTAESMLESKHLAAARHQLGGDALRLLAQPVERSVPPGALVLPPAVEREFDAFISRCRGRDRMWDGLGATLSATANRGCRALFVGESGTGKTLAVSSLATQLGAPLYRVDLAAVMNKYIGESEKNLGRVLDLAAAHDAVLLFDEADALFSQRSEAGETGERYVNLLTNFLLTRFELHSGIVVLTANSRARIDRAFIRRIDAIIEFPLPGPADRAKLWASHLGARSPGTEACQYLAGWCDLAGGHIRNAVLSAAARLTVGAIPLDVLAAAAAAEYSKLGRPVPAALGAVRP